MYRSFEDLEVWKRAVDLSVHIYGALRGSKEWSLRDQICRAAVSIPSNIAEGMERNTVKDQSHFLHIAKGSCAEVRTQLVIAQRIGMLSPEQADQMKPEAEALSRMLHGLIKSLQKPPALNT